jgi:hypothetical protein
MMFSLTVKLRITYRYRNGTKRYVVACKTFRREFIPPVGSLFHIRGSRGVELSAAVSEIWWGEDFVEVYTAEQIYSDGNLDKSLEEHLQLLTNDHWAVT